MPEKNRKAINPVDEPIPGGYQNVKEAWALYDTVLIGRIKSKVPGWVDSYATLGQNNRIPFFNVRNSGECSIAYNNLETKDQMPYVFLLYSLGASFIAPPGIPALASISGVDYNAMSDVLFTQTIPEHVGFRLKIRQDEKLIHNIRLAPEGVGVYGNLFANDPAGANTQSVTSGTNGQPYLDNRWKFPNPIAIPRGCTYSVEMELSNYCADLLKAMCGPSQYQFQCETDTPTDVPSVAMIRVSMIGKRQVQQRGELHY